jgi:23S rRNA (adenine2503-C2)-methyltransferase
VEQAVRFARDLRARGERLSNVVLMGMGEPFHNYDAALAAIRRLIADLGIGARHITVSTVGLVPQIRRFADEGLQVRLAISLHAATDAERAALLPVNRRWPIGELLDACREYAGKTGRRVTFEWALIAGRNDDEGTAHTLGRLLSGLPAHVNLIPLNPTRGYPGEPTAVAAADRFVAVLRGHGVEATVRVRRGIDIDAGCGQLAARTPP